MQRKAEKKTVVFLTGISILLAVVVFIGTGSMAEAQMYSQPVKAADYFYEMTFDDYREDTKLETLQLYNYSGCSIVRNGDFIGRNFDFWFNENPVFLVRVKAKEGRHASVGMAIHFGMVEEKLLAGDYAEKLELLPNMTVDGINDAGVFCGENIAPKFDTAEVTGTDPEGRSLHMFFVPRFVLDNASSADEAVQLLKTQNLYGSFCGYAYAHYMIADKDKTYIVEIIDNKVRAVEKKGNEQVMTNFYCNLPKYPEHPAGLERYEILQAAYDMGNTFDGMFALLQKVKSSNEYDLTVHPRWYSETWLSLAKINEPGFYAAYQETYRKNSHDYWEARKNDRRDEAQTRFWSQTIHNSTYDLAKKMLRVAVQENYDRTFDYYLDEK